MKWYHGFAGVLVVLLIAGVATDAVLVTRRARYRDEIVRLRQGMSTSERRKADLEFAASKDRMRVMMALLRRQAEGDRALHLAVAVDSGIMYLSEEGALLRAMPVRVASDQRLGKPPDTLHLASPRGTRTIARLAPDTITLDGGTQIYANPASDRLDDSLGVSAGDVRARAADLNAIQPVLTPGMTVYLY